MDLALNNLQRLICHETQTTNQPSSFVSSSSLTPFFLLSFIFFFLSLTPKFPSSLLSFSLSLFPSVSSTFSLFTSSFAFIPPSLLSSYLLSVFFSHSPEYPLYLFLLCVRWNYSTDFIYQIARHAFLTFFLLTNSTSRFPIRTLKIKTTKSGPLPLFWTGLTTKWFLLWKWKCKPIFFQFVLWFFKKCLLFTCFFCLFFFLKFPLMCVETFFYVIHIFLWNLVEGNDNLEGLFYIFFYNLIKS